MRSMGKKKGAMSMENKHRHVVYTETRTSRGRGHEMPGRVVRVLVGYGRRKLPKDSASRRDGTGHPVAWNIHYRNDEDYNGKVCKKVTENNVKQSSYVKSGGE